MTSNWSTNNMWSLPTQCCVLRHIHFMKHVLFLWKVPGNRCQWVFFRNSQLFFSTLLDILCSRDCPTGVAALGLSVQSPGPLASRPVLVQAVHVCRPWPRVLFFTRFTVLVEWTWNWQSLCTWLADFKHSGSVSCRTWGWGWWWERHKCWSQNVSWWPQLPLDSVAAHC